MRVRRPKVSPSLDWWAPDLIRRLPVQSDGLLEADNINLFTPSH